MASNSFGEIFRITTWGESHGPAIGVVIDGCPAGLAIATEEIHTALQQRAPGMHALTSPRKEPDQPRILSGVFEGVTTGAPISIMIDNADADSSKYEAIKDLYRPGHANFTYIKKYGVFDYRGGGRASARETACRVAAGAVAQKLLTSQGIIVTAYLSAIGNVTATQPQKQPAGINTPNEPTISQPMQQALQHAIENGESLGGIVTCKVNHCPVGLGDPVYQKLPAKLAGAMLSIPAAKGFEIGAGFAACSMTGSQHNDAFVTTPNDTSLKSNHAGGTLGGISNGQDILFNVAFKPTSSINKPQSTVRTDNQTAAVFNLPPGSRHDPCVAIRAVEVVKAMAALVITDAWLLARCTRLTP